jgi:FixJ family two-component response regulator
MSPEADAPPTVFVVDDDASAAESMRWLIESVGLNVEVFASADDFLAAYQPDRPGCLLLDVRMPGMSGLELQEALNARGDPPPVIFITAYSDVPVAVRAMRAGAYDLLLKPVNHQALIDCLQEAVRKDAAGRRERAVRRVQSERFAGLSPRELEVLRRVVGGLPSSQIAVELGISHKTVEVHRASIMTKSGAASLAELIRLAFQNGVSGSHGPPRDAARQSRAVNAAPRASN